MSGFSNSWVRFAKGNENENENSLKEEKLEKNFTKKSLSTIWTASQYLPNDKLSPEDCQRFYKFHSAWHNEIQKNSVQRSRRKTFPYK